MTTYSKTKQWLQAGTDFVLLLLSYYLCCIVRGWNIIGQYYPMKDAKDYAFVAVIFALIVVAVHAFMGSYSRIKYRGFAKDSLRVILTNLAALLIISSILFLFRIDQFSRVLLFLYVFVSAVLLIIKRRSLDKLIQKKEKREDSPAVLHTTDIMGVKVAVTNMNDTIRIIQEHLEEWRGKYICVANVHTTVTSYENEDYRAIQNNAAMVLPDGAPLSQYSREQNYPEAQRVTGPDLMNRILELSADQGWRHYFYGSTPETLERLQASIEDLYFGTEIAGMYSPPFRALTLEEDAEIIEKINAANPDFVWVGLGAPKQEKWMYAHQDKIHALMIGVGAAFDYEAGNIKRAPAWMQKMSLEWLYRLMQDPGRLLNRYVTTNVKYLWWKWRH